MAGAIAFLQTPREQIKLLLAVYRSRSCTRCCLANSIHQKITPQYLKKSFKKEQS